METKDHVMRIMKYHVVKMLFMNGPLLRTAIMIFWMNIMKKYISAI